MSSHRNTATALADLLMVAAIVAGALTAATRHVPVQNRAASPPAVAGLAEVLRAKAGSLLDARPSADYLAGHIPGAVSVPPGGLPVLATMAEGSILYGENPACPHPAILLRKMESAGARGVRLYPGGMEEYRSCGLPVAR